MESRTELVLFSEVSLGWREPLPDSQQTHQRPAWRLRGGIKCRVGCSWYCCYNCPSCVTITLAWCVLHINQPIMELFRKPVSCMSTLHFIFQPWLNYSFTFSYAQSTEQLCNISLSSAKESPVPCFSRDHFQLCLNFCYCLFDAFPLCRSSPGEMETTPFSTTAMSTLSLMAMRSTKVFVAPSLTLHLIHIASDNGPSHLDWHSKAIPKIVSNIFLFSRSSRGGTATTPCSTTPTWTPSPTAMRSKSTKSWSDQLSPFYPQVKNFSSFYRSW